jgi:hypothetical protein
MRGSFFKNVTPVELETCETRAVIIMTALREFVFTEKLVTRRRGERGGSQE